MYVVAFKVIRFGQSFFFLVPPLLFVSYVRLGLSLETLLDPGWRFLEESPYGRMGRHQ